MDKNLTKKRIIGRKRMGRPSLHEGPRSKVDWERICKVLGFGDVPPNISEMALIDLWNDMTDYYLPRLEDRGKPLEEMSKPIQDRVDELELWRRDD